MFRSMRNRQFNTLEEALEDNRKMAAEQLAKERQMKVQEEAATTATVGQVIWVVAVICLAFVFPICAMPLLGLTFWYFGRNR